MGLKWQTDEEKEKDTWNYFEWEEWKVDPQNASNGSQTLGPNVLKMLQLDMSRHTTKVSMSSFCRNNIWKKKSIRKTLEK